MNGSKVNSSVLHIISSSNIGGSPKHTLLLCEELGKLGVHCSLFYPNGGSYEKQFLESGIPCYPIGKLNPFSPSLYKTIGKIIRDENINAVHTHELRSDIVGYIASKIFKVPVVTTIHNMITKGRLSPIKKVIYSFTSRWIYNSIQKVIAVSDAVRKNLIEELGVRASQIITIPNGTKIVDGNAFNSPIELRKSLGVSPESPLLSCISRLIPVQKGQDVLIKSLPLVLEKFPDCQLLIVGDGAIRQELESLVQSLKLEKNVLFTGWRNDTNEILNASDICIIPSLWDPLPRIVLEAMMLSKPVVASNVDGIRETIIDQQTGILVPPSNPKELASAILRLLNEPVLAKEMGIKGRERVMNHFTSERHARDTMTVYNQIRESFIQR